MTSAWARAAGVAIAAVLLAATGCWSQTLRIFPSQKQQTVALGKSVVLTCQVDAPDPALVTQPQWRNPKGLIINEGSRPVIYTESIPAKQSQLLYISGLTRSMAGNYSCSATYTNMPLSDYIILKPFIAITWNNAKETQFATYGKDYKVMCDVTAEPAPSVDWFINGLSVVTGNRYVIHTNGLEIKNVSNSDEGIYTCRAVVIQTGELSTRNIKLEVYTAPTLRKNNSVVVFKEGDSVQLECKGQGSPTPLYSWVKDSTKQNLSLASRFAVNEFTGILNFDRVEASDYGKYVCHATNRAGSDQADYFVEVIIAPKIYELQNTTAPVKTEGSLTCKATGRPAPHVSFRKQGHDASFVNGQNDNGRINLDLEKTQSGDLMSTTAVMTIQNLNRSDDGLYECIANNKGGEARKNGLLTVQFQPTFENMPKAPVWTWNRQPVNVSCLAESIPNATIKWKRYDFDLVESHHVRIYGSGPYSYVTIIPTDPTLYGNYKCVATNPLGEAEHTIQLREAFVPGPVVQVRQEVITATSVSFSINGPAEDMGPPILAYTVQYKENGNIDWNFAMNRTWSVNSPYIVENLKPMYSYDFRFAAVNQVGAGPWAAPMMISMPKRSAPETPKWRESVSSDSLIRSKVTDRYELRWKIPANNGEPIIKYEITYCPVLKVSGEWRVAAKTECVTDELKSYQAISYEVTGLRPDTRYRMELRAYNILGSSAPAHMFVQTALGVDKTGHAKARLLSAGAIIGLAVAGILLCLFLVDLLLLCIRRTGVMATLCTSRPASTNKDEEAKEGRDEKEPLKDLEPGPLRRNSSIEFDGLRTYTTSGGPIIGMNSAV